MCLLSVTVVNTVCGVRCLGCRGVCMCNAGWSGENCAVADCPMDNCFGHGVCNQDGDCECITGYSGTYCSDLATQSCQEGCYGQGDCKRGTFAESLNITVSSCICTSKYEGQLCSYFPDDKTYLPLLPPNILASVAVCAVVFVFACWVIYWNAKMDAREEYEKYKHVNPMTIGLKSKVETDDDEELKLIPTIEEDLEEDDEEELARIRYK